MSADPIRLTEEQDRAMQAVVAWYRSACVGGPLHLTCGGFAGTGKSTVMAQLPRILREARVEHFSGAVATAHQGRDRYGGHLDDLLGDLIDRADQEDLEDALEEAREECGLAIAYAAPTGKAADVLRNKLDAQGASYVSCSTVHSLIYRPITDSRGQVIGWSKREKIEADLVVLDEASMIGEEQYDDLCEHRVPMLFVGDHGQLPPVNSSLNLMANPVIRLETVHRQALDNPILAVATAIRTGQPLGQLRLDPNKVWFGNGRQAMEQVVSTMVRNGFTLDHAILCHTNRMRVEINRGVRQMLGRGNVPEVGDMVVCLKNTKIDDATVVFNGVRGVIDGLFRVEGGAADTGQPLGLSLSDFQVGVEASFGSLRIAEAALLTQFHRDKAYASCEEFEMEVCQRVRVRHIRQLGLLLDYGWAITGHRSQGSEFNDVLVIIERSIFRPDPVVPDFAARFLYTCFSRAKNRLACVWV